MNEKILSNYRKFRASGMAARYALSAAKTLVSWQKRELAEVVRLRQEHEQENYFDVYGEPETEKEREQICNLIETWGCWWLVAEWFDGSEWHQADSIGMCIYENPLSPFENWYVPDLMRSALDALRESWEVSDGDYHELAA